jgi:regulator of protease activity HflC (stomatin/prohibitin superfamily)
MEIPAFLIVILFLVIITLFKGVKIVPQQQAWVIERLGKFNEVLEPGLNLIIPFFDKVSYKHTLKEQAMDIRSQSAITKDNVTLQLDGIIYVRIIDPKQASYGVADPYFALSQLAQTSMRSEIGKMDLDKTFEERERLNSNIVNSLNEASSTWGIQCMRYEIKDITPPTNILKAMEQQVTAERMKRAQILESEGLRQAKVNNAEGEKAEQVLASEGMKIEQINQAQGEAEAIISVAEATAKGIELVATAINKAGGKDAVSLQVAEKYIAAFSNLAKTNNTILLPTNAGDVGGFVAQAMSVFETIKAASPANSNSSAPGNTPTQGPWNS